ncbi:hypothetical protein ACF0H5_012238 [Mactra antiquata]
MTGANDIGRKSPEQILDDMLVICETVHHQSPSARILLSEILPRGQNMFPKCAISNYYLRKWNEDATAVNKLMKNGRLNQEWLSVIELTEFHDADKKTSIQKKKSVLNQKGGLFPLLALAPVIAKAVAADALSGGVAQLVKKI